MHESCKALIGNAPSHKSTLVLCAARRLLTDLLYSSPYRPATCTRPASVAFTLQSDTRWYDF